MTEDRIPSFMKETTSNVPSSPDPVTMKFLVQPQMFGHLFRYESEGSNHGKLKGEGSNEEPSVELTNNTSDDVPVTIKISLVSTDQDAKIHLNAIVLKESKKGSPKQPAPEDIVLKPGKYLYKIHDVFIQRPKDESIKESLLKRMCYKDNLKEKFASPQCDHAKLTIGDVHSFTNPHIKDKYIDKKIPEDLPAETKEKCNCCVKRLFGDLRLDECRLKVEAIPASSTISIKPIISNNIYDGKSKKGKIYQLHDINPTRGSMTGKEMIWMEVGIVDPEDVVVNFEQTVQGNIVWEEKTVPFYVKNNLIKLETPEYSKGTIATSDVDVDVFISRRLNHKQISEKKKFTYKRPIDSERKDISEEPRSKQEKRSSCQYDNATYEPSQTPTLSSNGGVLNPVQNLQKHKTQQQQVVIQPQSSLQQQQQQPQLQQQQPQQQQQQTQLQQQQPHLQQPQQQQQQQRQLQQQQQQQQQSHLQPNESTPRNSFIITEQVLAGIDNIEQDHSSHFQSVSIERNRQQQQQLLQQQPQQLNLKQQQQHQQNQQQPQQHLLQQQPQQQQQQQSNDEGQYLSFN